jgi:hypothetical protein
MKRVHLYLPDGTISFFTAIAKAMDIKEAELYRRALYEWKEQFVDKRMEKMKRDKLL